MRYLKAGISLPTQYQDILKELLEFGTPRSTRDTKSIELSPFCWSTMHPLRNVVTSKARNINKAFSIAEFLWILSGRNDLEMIGFYNKNIKNYARDGSSFDGAYGPKLAQQLNYVLSALLKDKFSRQAVITLWERNPTPSNDIPCTVMLHFLVDNHEKLNLIVYMRSNDAWLGFPYDVYNFTMIQNYMACLLCLGIGTYTHVAGSLHLYEEHIDKAKNVINEIVKVQDIIESKIFTTNELKEAMLLEQKIRTGQLVDLDIIEKLSESWKSMVLELKKYSENKCVQAGHHAL